MFGEYLNIVLMCAMMTILFLGGWHGPIPLSADFVNMFPAWIVNLGHLAWFMAKLVILLLPVRAREGRRAALSL